MLNINPDIVRNIIQYAKEFYVKEPASLTDKPGQYPEEYDWTQYLADHEDDLNYQQAIKQIDDLEPDQQITLIAMLYLGRGDYDKADWQQALEEAKNNWNEKTGEYLMKHPQLPEYLEEALTQFGYEVQI